MRSLISSLACAILLAAPTAATAAGDPLRSKQYGLDILESDAAHSMATGRGAVIAIVDTGVLATHPDLQGGRLLAGYDFVDEDPIPQDGDRDGHGTHVLGIAGATEGNGVGVASVAPGAKLLPVRVFGNDGGVSGDESEAEIVDVVQGIDYSVAQGADVINLSLGLPVVGSDRDFDAAIDRALDAGRVVIAAAGNDGAPACSQPSGRGRLLCVGSVDKRRLRSVFSNFSGSLGVMAPGGSALPFGGEDILSTVNDGGYTELAGTSQATPHVAGVAALLVEKGLRGRAVVQRILATSTDAGQPGPDEEYGAGIVNARRAVTGLGAPGSGPGPGAGTGAGSAAVVSLRRTQRIRTVLRRGVRVRCVAAGDGRCTVVASRRGKRHAAGSAPLRAGRSTVTVAKLNRRGRTVLRRAQRRNRAIALRVTVTLPGAGPQVRRLKLRP